MNALLAPVAIKDEVWSVEMGYWLTRTPGSYDQEGPIFTNSLSSAERCQRFSDCVTAFVGIEDPVAEMSRLRQIEQRWNAITSAPMQTMALLGSGVWSLLPDHEDAKASPAPWIVVDSWPGPLLYLARDKWEASAQKAEVHFLYDEALDEAERMGGEIVSLSQVVAS